MCIYVVAKHYECIIIHYEINVTAIDAFFIERVKYLYMK